MRSVAQKSALFGTVRKLDVQLRALDTTRCQPIFWSCDRLKYDPAHGTGRGNFFLRHCDASRDFVHRRKKDCYLCEGSEKNRSHTLPKKSAQSFLRLGTSWLFTRALHGFSHEQPFKLQGHAENLATSFLLLSLFCLLSYLNAFRRDKKRAKTALLTTMLVLRP